MDGEWFRGGKSTLASIFDNGKIARTRKQVKTKNYKLKEIFFQRLVRMPSGAEDPLFIVESQAGIILKQSHNSQLLCHFCWAC